MASYCIFWQFFFKCPDIIKQRWNFVCSSVNQAVHTLRIKLRGPQLWNLVHKYWRGFSRPQRDFYKNQSRFFKMILLCKRKIIYANNTIYANINREWFISVGSAIGKALLLEVHIFKCVFFCINTLLFCRKLTKFMINNQNINFSHRLMFVKCALFCINILFRKKLAKFAMLFRSNCMEFLVKIWISRTFSEKSERIFTSHQQ